MAAFQFSLNVTLPIFLVIVLGWCLMHVGLLNEGFAAASDKLVFKVALPALMFQDIAAMDLRADFSWGFVGFCIAVTTVMFTACYLGARIFLKDKSLVGAFAQAAARSSAAVLGIAFVQNLYGDSGLTPMMIVAAVPLFNIYSVIILTLGASDRTQGAGAVKKALIGVVTNPIILGILAGVLWNLSGLTLPVIFQRTISSVGSTATPLALLTVGANFRGREALAKLGPTLAATVIKLLVLPAVFLPVAVALGFRGSALAAILIMTGSPTTVTCYIMAKNMKNDAVLSGSVVMTATALSAVSLTFWVWLLRLLSLL